MPWSRHLDRRNDLLDLLHAEVEREPVDIDERVTARLFVVAQPVSADPRLLLDSIPERDVRHWLNARHKERLFQSSRPYRPNLAGASSLHRRSHGAAKSSEYVESDRTVPQDARVREVVRHVIDLEVREDGGIRLYYGRASDIMREVQYLMLGAIVGEVAGVIEMARLVSAQSSFHGSWGFGVALRGVRSIAAYDTDTTWFDGGWKFSEDEYDETAEVDSFALEEPGSPVLELLVGRLARATAGSSYRVADVDLFAIEDES